MNNVLFEIRLFNLGQLFCIYLFCSQGAAELELTAAGSFPHRADLVFFREDGSTCFHLLFHKVGVVRPGESAAVIKGRAHLIDRTCRSVLDAAPGQTVNCLIDKEKNGSRKQFDCGSSESRPEPAPWILIDIQPS